MKLSLICGLLALLGSAPLFAKAQKLELLVPAYGNPCCAGGPDMWTKLTNTAASGVVKVNIILNPGSGPAPLPFDGGIDPNYIGYTPSATDPLLAFTAAGGIAYGYVATGFGDRDITLVKTDIDTYYDNTLTYWRGEPIQVSGIFFDEMTNDLDKLEYYQELRDYVKGIESSAKVIMNPGTSFLTDTGNKGFTATDFAESADTIVTFEQTGAKYRDESFYTDPSWLDDYPAENFGHLIHTEATIADMQKDVALACTRKAGMLYVTNEDVPNNPWDYLAAYRDELVAAIESSACNKDSDGDGVNKDSDVDGVIDSEDLCPDTVTPESIPTIQLRGRRWALTDADTVFDTVRNPEGLSFNISDTGGCSAEQILEKLELPVKSYKRHQKYGLTTEAMQKWIDRIQSNP